MRISYSPLLVMLCRFSVATIGIVVAIVVAAFVFVTLLLLLRALSSHDLLSMRSFLLIIPSGIAGSPSF